MVTGLSLQFRVWPSHVSPEPRLPSFFASLWFGDLLHQLTSGRLPPGTPGFCDRSPCWQPLSLPQTLDAEPALRPRPPFPRIPRYTAPASGSFLRCLDFSAVISSIAWQLSRPVILLFHHLLDPSHESVQLFSPGAPTWAADYWEQITQLFPWSLPPNSLPKHFSLRKSLNLRYHGFPPIHTLLFNY